MAIKSEVKFTVACMDCNFHTTASTAGSAEELAGEHIQQWSDNGGNPNINHKCEITQTTVVEYDYH